MLNFEINNKEVHKLKVHELKGNYQFKSPYHKDKMMLPFNVLGISSTDYNYPIEVYTVEYKGHIKKDHYGNYKEVDVREFIESGFLTKI